MKVVISTKARADLLEISHWIAGDSARQASLFIARLTKTIRGLDRLPDRYPLVGQGDLRRMPFEAYLVFYRVTDKVEIARIIHGARDWVRLLDDLL